MGLRNRIFPEPTEEPTPSGSPTTDEEPRSPTAFGATPSSLELPFRERVINLRLRSVEAGNCNDFKYWYHRQHRDPEMTAVAEIILALLITQVSVERAFSHLPLVITDHRNRIHTQRVDDTLVIKLNCFQQPKPSWDSVLCTHQRRNNNILRAWRRRFFGAFCCCKTSEL